MTRETPGCIVETLVVASGLFFVLLGISGMMGCGGGQQLSGHAAVTAACISEEQRVVAEVTTQEDAHDRLTPLRAACDALLAIIAEPPTSGGEAP